MRERHMYDMTYNKKSGMSKLIKVGISYIGQHGRRLVEVDIFPSVIKNRS